MTYTAYSRQRLEKKARLDELNPEETLRLIGLKEGDVFCDIGAGTGIFTIPAAKITGNTVHALELNEEMIRIIEEKAKSEKLTNVKTAIVRTDLFPVPSQTCDVVMLSTVLREIDDKDSLLKEMRRILRCAESKLVVIELHKRLTQIGPPVELRMSDDEVREIVEDEGFTLEDNVSLGNNYYCLTFLRS